MAGTITALAMLGFWLFTWKKPGWGLALLPVAIAAVLITGIAFEKLYFLIAAAALFPVTVFVVRLAPCASPLETPWHKTVAGVVITILGYLVLLAILTGVFHVLGPVLFVLVVVGVVRYKLTHRYSLAMDVFSAIGMAMRQSLPLPMALDAAAQGQKNRPAKIFSAISNLLTEGRPLSEAIRLGYPKCPPELLASITAAEQMDQLPKTVEALQADITEKVNDYKRVRPVHPWYPLLVLVVAFFVVLGLSVFIVPTLSEVISDISDGQACLPASTQAMFDISRFFTGNKGLNALLFTVAGLGIVLYFVTGCFRRRNPYRLRLRDRIEDWVKWHLPVVHWFEKTHSHLQLIEMLRVGLNAGYPVNTTLRNSLGLDVNNCFRRKAACWLERIERGEPIVPAAITCGFDKMLVWAFDDSVNKGNAPAILEGLEDIYRSRYNHRINLLNAIGCPLMVLGLGAGVGWVVYAMFMGAFSTLFVTIQYTMP